MYDVVWQKSTKLIKCFMWFNVKYGCSFLSNY